MTLVQVANTRQIEAGSSWAYDYLESIDVHS